MGDLIGNVVDSELYYFPKSEFDRVRALKAPASDIVALFADMARFNALYMIARAGSGHIGSSFSCMELVAQLLLEEMDGNAGDVFFSSKGHDAPALYALMIALGRLPEESIHALRRLGGLPGHPDIGTSGIVTNTGSLGMGISKAKGILAARRLRGERGRVFVMTGDGELQEGQIWESLISAANDRLAELTVIVDHNKFQSDYAVERTSSLGDLAAKFAAFGWHVERVDGHDLALIGEVLERLRVVLKRPKVVIAETIKGKGVSFMEGAAIDSDVEMFRFHSGAPTAKEYLRAVEEIEARITSRLWALGAKPIAAEKVSRPVAAKPAAASVRLVPAYTEALIEAGNRHADLVALDADLVTDMGLMPFAQAYPNRFFECGIAEQDMVSQAGGMARSGLLPVVHSFSSFLSARPNEQIYNNATEGTKIVYVGGLSGVSAGGPWPFPPEPARGVGGRWHSGPCHGRAVLSGGGGPAARLVLGEARRSEFSATGLGALSDGRAAAARLQTGGGTRLRAEGRPRRHHHCVGPHHGCGSFGCGGFTGAEEALGWRGEPALAQPRGSQLDSRCRRANRRDRNPREPFHGGRPGYGGAGRTGLFQCAPNAALPVDRGGQGAAVGAQRGGARGTRPRPASDCSAHRDVLGGVRHMLADLRHAIRTRPEFARARLMRLRLLTRAGGAHQDLSGLLASDARAWNAARTAAQNGKRVLIATNTGGHFGLAGIDRLLAVALTLRGAHVAMALCDGALPACQMCEINLVPDAKTFAASGPPVSMCGYCRDGAFRAAGPLGLTLHGLERFVTEQDRWAANELAHSTPLEHLSTTTWKRLPVGEHALAGALRYFARGSLAGETHAEAVLRRFCAATVVAAAAYERIFEAHEPEVVVAHHGIYVPQGIVAALARSRGMRVVTWNPAYRRKCFIFSHDATYHHTLMDEPAEVWAREPLSSAQQERIESYLCSRRQGTEDWIRFHKARHGDDEAEWRAMALDPGKPLVAAYTNVFWDAQLHYASNVFASQKEWLIETVDLFSRRPDLQLVIRVHPAEVTGSPPSRQCAADEIAQTFPILPANVRIVGPRSALVVVPAG